jgi:hypothetical protein
VEALADKPLTELNIDALETLWIEAKRVERSNAAG